MKNEQALPPCHCLQTCLKLSSLSSDSHTLLNNFRRAEAVSVSEFFKSRKSLNKTPSGSIWTYSCFLCKKRNLQSLQKIEWVGIGYTACQICLFHWVLQGKCLFLFYFFLRAHVSTRKIFLSFSIWEVILQVSTVPIFSYFSEDCVATNKVLEMPQMILLGDCKALWWSALGFICFPSPAPAVFVLTALERRLKNLWPPLTSPISQIKKAGNLKEWITNK